MTRRMTVSSVVSLAPSLFTRVILQDPQAREAVEFIVQVEDSEFFQLDGEYAVTFSKREDIK